MNFTNDTTVNYVDPLGDDLRGVDAARVSYARDGETAEIGPRERKLLRYLIKHGHWSPFEHCSVTIRVHTPIFVARQWMRHRSHAFNEVSGRYTELEAEFFLPHEWRIQDTENRQGSRGPVGPATQLDAYDKVRYANQVCADVYRFLLDVGISREQARMVLPTSTMTSFYDTMSLRSALHFLHDRDAPTAQREIAQPAVDLRTLLYRLFPEVMAAWDERAR